MDVLLLRAYASAGMCLPSRCLAMGLHVTIFMNRNLTSLVWHIHKVRYRCVTGYRNVLISGPRVKQSLQICILTSLLSLLHQLWHTNPFLIQSVRYSSANNISFLLCLFKTLFIKNVYSCWGHAFGWGNMLHSGRSRVRFPNKSLDSFNLSRNSSRIMALGFTQPLTEMSTRNLPGSKGRRTRKADKLTAICEPIF
jgi:hypothetical protein